jgi:hypothetical protein
VSVRFTGKTVLIIGGWRFSDYYCALPGQGEKHLFLSMKILIGVPSFEGLIMVDFNK